MDPLYTAKLGRALGAGAVVHSGLERAGGRGCSYAYLCVWPVSL